VSEGSFLEHIELGVDLTCELLHVRPQLIDAVDDALHFTGHGLSAEWAGHGDLSALVDLLDFEAP